MIMIDDGLKMKKSLVFFLSLTPALQNEVDRDFLGNLFI